MKIKKVYLGQRQIYPEKEPWEPGTNTIAYYQFNSNLNDSSWNSNNLSTSAWTVTYWTTEQWAKYAYFNGATYTSYLTKSINYADPNTICFRANAKKSGNGYVMLEMWNDGREYARIHPNVNIEYWWGLSSSRALNTWYLLTYVREWSTAKLYINWTQVRTGTPTTTTWTRSIRFRLNQVGNQTSTSYCADYYISELIRESKVRSDQEITDYYNSTKSLYGIS